MSEFITKQPIVDNKVQDEFLYTVTTKKMLVTVFLSSGVKLTGYITKCDTYTLLLTLIRDGKVQGELNPQVQLVYKKNISTILPGQPPPPERSNNDRRGYKG